MGIRSSGLTSEEELSSDWRRLPWGGGHVAALLRFCALGSGMKFCDCPQVQGLVVLHDASPIQRP